MARLGRHGSRFVTALMGINDTTWSSVPELEAVDHAHCLHMDYVYVIKSVQVYFLDKNLKE